MSESSWMCSLEKARVDFKAFGDSLSVLAFPCDLAKLGYLVDSS